MTEPFVETYRGHELRFAPTPLVGGGFVARLQVSHCFGAHRDEFTVDVGAVVFEAQDQAALHARRIGRTWVDDRQ